jgi:hypothetical protein
MADPRLDGSHLDTGRYDQYGAAVGELLDRRGPATGDVDALISRPLVPAPPARRPRLPPGGTYSLVSLADGRRHRLRVGVNALGRLADNDLVLDPDHVSRRHCLVLVHATGGCEVSDTASRNGTAVNGRRVGRADLQPGDVLALTDQRFLVEWVGPDGRVLPELQAAETSFLGDPARTGW